MAHLVSNIALSRFGRSGRLQALVRPRGRGPGNTPQATKVQLPSGGRLPLEADSAPSERGAPSDSRDPRLDHRLGIVAWPVRIASCPPGTLSRSIRRTTRPSSISSETAAPSRSLDDRLHHSVGSLALPVRIASCSPGPLSRPIRAAPTSETYRNGRGPNGLRLSRRSGRSCPTAFEAWRIRRQTLRFRDSAAPVGFRRLFDRWVAIVATRCKPRRRNSSLAGACPLRLTPPRARAPRLRIPVTLVWTTPSGLWRGQ